MDLSDEEKLAEDVSYWFEALERNKPVSERVAGIGTVVPVQPSRFRRIMPLSGRYIGDDWVAFGDATPRDVDWPIDICTLATFEKSHWCKWQIHRFVSISPKDVRGQVRRIGKHMLRVSSWAAPREGNGNPLSVDNVLTFLSGAWVESGSQNWWYRGMSRGGEAIYIPDAAPQFSGEINDLASVACGLAFNRRYEWGCEVSIEDDAPSLFLPSDPTGVRALFSHRERNPLTNRRDALLHWVRAHFRRRRADHEDMTWVRRHLRGAWAFDWYGMRVVIHPSQYDLETALSCA